jgi:hypothetical protein
MFCRARFSGGLPPSALKRGILPVTVVKSVSREATMESMDTSMW